MFKRIESAPKDRPIILLIQPMEGAEPVQVIGCWNTPKITRHVNEDEKTWVVNWNHDKIGSQIHGIYVVTHWTELPTTFPNNIE